MNATPMRQTGEVSFAVQVRLRRALTPQVEQAFERCVTDWLAERGMRADGVQTSFVVAADRDLSATDQADVLIMMLDDPAVRRARIGSLATEGDESTEVACDLLWVEADGQDPLVAAGRALYEAGRLSAEKFLDAIGGYVSRPGERMEG